MKPGYLSEIFVSFQGEGAHVGRRHLFVRLAGCNLRCRYCDTPDSLERTGTYAVHRGDRPVVRSNPVAAEEVALLVRTILADEPAIDAVAVTGGEPLTQSEFLARFLGAVRPSVPVLLETNGVLPRRLAEVLPLVDIISMDIKPPSNTGEAGFWDEHSEFIGLARTKELYVKVLVDQETLAEEVGRAAEMVASFSPEASLFLQPIVDACGRIAIDAEQLTNLFLVARRYLTTVRVLPQTHKQLGIR